VEGVFVAAAPRRSDIFLPGVRTSLFEMGLGYPPRRHARHCQRHQSCLLGLDNTQQSVLLQVISATADFG